MPLMPRYGYLILLCLIGSNLVSCRQEQETPLFHNWTFLSTFDADQAEKIMIPVGGIGTGTVSMNGRGKLADPGFIDCLPRNPSPPEDKPASPVFTIYVRTDGKDPIVRSLTGLPAEDDFKNINIPISESHLRGFKKTAFEGAYPFSVVRLRDSELPVEVNIKTFNPLIPGKTGPSSIPIVVLIYEVKNITNSLVEVSVCGAMRNPPDSGFEKTANKDSIAPNNNLTVEGINRYLEFRDVQGIYMVSENRAQNDHVKGSIALSTSNADSVTYLSSVKGKSPEEGLEEVLNDFSRDGELTVSRDSSETYPLAALAMKQFLNPGETRYFRFFITWHFTSRGNNANENFYAADYTDAWDVAKKITPYLPGFEEHSMLFIKALKESDIPETLTEAAVSNLSGLSSGMLFRDQEGNMAPGSCDTLSDYAGNYSSWRLDFSFPYLFGILSKTMSSQMLKHNDMSSEGILSAIVKLYNDWQLSADSVLLADSWTNVKNALLTCTPDIDPDSDGICDVSGQADAESGDIGRIMGQQFYYLGALKAALIMAETMSDSAFISEYSGPYGKGSAWVKNTMKSVSPDKFETGTFTGLALATLSGLSGIADSDILKKLLLNAYTQTISQYKASSTLNMCTCGEEYAVAALCIYEGLTNEGISWIKAISKNNARTGNPYYKAENNCSWSAATAAWAGIIAYTQFRYSRITGTMNFSSRPGTYFWSDGYAWGVVKTGENKGGITETEVRVLSGELRLSKMILNGFGERELSSDEPVLIKTGESLPFAVVRYN